MRTCLIGVWLRRAALTALVLLVAGCSTLKLAYQQVPNLAYWQLQRHLDLTDTQAERVRGELDAWHRWHREAMLPQHAQWLQGVRHLLPQQVSAAQACQAYDGLRQQLEQVVAQTQPRLAWLATQLSDAQIRHLRKKQNESNVDWRKEWLEPSPQALREHRYERWLSHLERFYGRLEAPQKQALRAFVAQSSFDPQRSYAERLRRQTDLLQVLEAIAQDRDNLERARSLVRGYAERFAQSPDSAYQRYAEALAQESCAGLAQLHNAMAPAQRQRAAQTLATYQGDLVALALR